MDHRIEKLGRFCSRTERRLAGCHRKPTVQVNNSKQTEEGGFEMEAFV